MEITSVRRRRLPWWRSSKPSIPSGRRRRVTRPKPSCQSWDWDPRGRHALCGSRRAGVGLDFDSDDSGCAHRRPRLLARLVSASEGLSQCSIDSETDRVRRRKFDSVDSSRVPACDSGPCQALSAFLLFCGRVIYSSHGAAAHAACAERLKDQELAGALMWCWVTFAYVIPAVVITIQLLGMGVSLVDSGARDLTPLSTNQTALVEIPTVAKRAQLEWFDPSGKTRC